MLMSLFYALKIEDKKPLSDGICGGGHDKCQFSVVLLGINTMH